ncbi:terminase small subunit [Staphylococcus pseudintermedius]|nr:terminase small subunit [Staphylococcus pseudintermedius]EJG5090857.1 terminase small subunit [Staphylococcus pseudintermedius]EKH2225794.1 terminase small subunit [Staphylococcus pseudintermedius]MDK3642503.1 terminase small subunit [Staphylococcus pseudintermedius]MDK3682542.1 terminase small subunit [Staphylococcus pseudintermedius]
MKLSIKQQRFADEYIQSGNATQAYIKAGYSKNKANTNATKLLQNTTIKQYVKKRIEQAQEESLMSITEALALSASIARGEPQKAYTKRYDHLSDEVDKEVTYTITPNVEERQRSIDHILKVHGAYIDKKEIKQKNIEINIGDYDDES